MNQPAIEVVVTYIEAHKWIPHYQRMVRNVEKLLQLRQEIFSALLVLPTASAKKI
jgi:hypothetical protein